MQVSIVVLTYLQFETLHDTLLSIANQSFSDYEVILQDDGSPNYSAEQIESYIAEMPALKGKVFPYSNPQNVGIVRNYNAAVARSGGEIIVPLSADDSFADENVLSRIVEHFRVTSCNVCTARRRGADTGIVYPTEKVCRMLRSSDSEQLFKRCLFGNVISGSCLYCRKSFLHEQGPFDEQYTLLDDYPFVMRLLANHEKISFIDGVTINYGENGVTHQKRISEKLKKDNLTLFYTVIQPNIGTFRRETRRLKEYNYIYRYSGLSPVKKAVFNTQYMDIVLLKLFFKYRKMNDDDRYEFLEER